MKAQFESLTNQYDDNLAEIAACAARNDEGVLSYFSSVTLPFVLQLLFQSVVCLPRKPLSSSFMNYNR